MDDATNFHENSFQVQSVIFESLPVALLVIDRNGKIQFSNSLSWTLIGRKASELANESFESFLTIHTRSVFLEFLNSISYEKSPQVCTVNFLSSTEEKLFIELKGNPTFDSELIQIVLTEVENEQDSRISYKDKYEQIKTVANIGHWELDLLTLKWSWCTKIYEFYELDPTTDNITPELFLSLIHPEDREKVMNAFTNSLQSKKTYEVDHRILLNQTHIKWIRNSCHWILDDSGNALGAIGTSQDITRQIDLERRLQESEANYFELVEKSSSLIWSIDREGKFTYVNPAWEQVLGYKVKEIVNKSYSEFQPKEISERDKKELDKFNESGKAIKEGYETLYIAKDGQKRYLIFYSTAILDKDGKVVGSHGTAVDNTEKRITELQLEETYSELIQRQYAIDEHAIVAITNEEGKIIYVNRRFCEISKFSREELLGQNHRIIKSGYHTADFYQDLYRTIKKGKTWHGEFKNKAKDGSFYWVSTTIAPLKNSEGKIERYLSIRSDITSIKEAEEKIKLLLNEKALILVEVHHRIKNNMNTIYSLLRLEANTQENHSQKSILLDAANRVRSMMLLYDKLFRSENKESLSIKEYFPNLIFEILKIFPQSEKISTNIQVEPIVLEAKKLSSLGIIINELITNSMKYSFVDRTLGEISFNAKIVNDSLKITYEDNGIPMKPLVNLEEPKGFGLNLISILVHQLNGIAQIEPSEGNKFVIIFKI